MIRLQDIMTREVIAVSPDTSIREAMDIFTEHHVSGAPVVAGDRLVGVISAADLLAFASSLPAAAVERFPELDDAEWDGPVEWADGPSGAFFADAWGVDGAPTGDYALQAGATPNDVLDEHTVADAMTRTPLITMPPETAVPEAAELMRRARVHRVLVMEGDRLVGIVTALDIVRAVADGRLTVRTFVFPRADEP
jgi:CBS domain-containing protein